MEFERAQASLQAAEFCLAHGWVDSAVNYAYFALFQAAIYALERRGMRRREWTHKGVHILGTFQPVGPLLMELVPLRFHIGGHVQADLQGGGLEGLEDSRSHQLLQRPPNEGLTAGAPLHVFLLMAHVASARAVIALGRSHTQPTASTPDEAREQRGPMTDGALDGMAVGFQLALVALKLRPGDVGR